MNMKLVTGLMCLFAAILLCTALHAASSVFIPLVIAWFILQVLRPIIKIGETLKFPTILKIILVFAILVIAGVVGFNFCSSQVIEFAKVYSLYADKLNEGFYSLMTALNVPPETISSFDWMGILRSNVRNISEFIAAFASKLVMTFVFLMFMMLEAPDLEIKINKAFSGSSAIKIKNILASISEQVSHYLGTLTLISVVTGICAWVVLTVFEVQLAAGWGVLTVLLNFIPTVGSIIATIPPVVMAIIQFSPGFLKPLIVLILLTAIQVIIGNVITPKVVGDRLGVSPVMILLSLLLWGMIWGIPGMLLSVPIISIIKIVCENIPQLWPIAILMGTGESAKRAVTPSIITRRAEIKKMRFLRAQNEENAKELEKLNNLNKDTQEKN